MRRILRHSRSGDSQLHRQAGEDVVPFAFLCLSTAMRTHVNAVRRTGANSSYLFNKPVLLFHLKYVRLLLLDTRIRERSHSAMQQTSSRTAGCRLQPPVRRCDDAFRSRTRSASSPSIQNERNDNIHHPFGTHERIHSR